ncbi:MAG: ornithine carbamoyltransferase, partial [Alphaproteobacteria bacterium]
MTAPRHFLDLDALDGATLRGILDDAAAIKRRRAAGDRDRPLDGRMLAMIFEEPSTRTRVSFDAGMRQLGGQTVTLSPVDTHLGRGETIADTA